MTPPPRQNPYSPNFTRLAHQSAQKIAMCGAVWCVGFLSIVGQNELYFSEYIEGSGNNKGLEIHNPSSSDINLGSYSIDIHNNGNPAPSFSFSLAGQISAGNVFVLSHPMADNAITTKSNMVFPGIASFNGNDAIVLKRNTSTIDIIGNIGCDPGDSWSSGGNSTKDQVLVRKACILSGTRNNPGGCSFPTLTTEWTSYSASDFSHLGFHHWMVINQSMMPPVPNISSSPPLECSNDNGLIVIGAIGNGLEYSIDNGSNFFTHHQFLGLEGGIYDIVVRVTSDPSCDYHDQVTLAKKVPPIISVDAIHPPHCSNMATGSIDLSIFGGSGSFTYQWDGPSAIGNHEDPTGLSAGTYHVTVSDDQTMSCDTFLHNIIVPKSNQAALPVPLSAVDIDTLCQKDQPVTLDEIQDGFTGSWSGTGVANNIFDPSLMEGDHVLLFTPDPGECALPNSLTIYVQPEATPPLQPIDDPCALDPPIVLSNTQGGFSGKWSGPGVTNDSFDPTGLSGTQTLTFTPDAGQCAIANVISIDVQPAHIPSLTPMADLCFEDQPVELPAEQDGISGTWSGPGVTGNYFDPSIQIGIITLTFTPIPGECALSNDLSVHVKEAEIPLLQPLDNPCSIDPAISLSPLQEGIYGNWSGPGVADNSFNPIGLIGIQLLVFTPDQGQCALVNSLTIEVQPAYIPTLVPIADLCYEDTPVELPLVQDGITGTWAGSGVTDNLLDPSELMRSIVLTFTPDQGMCALPGELTVNIDPGIKPQLQTIRDPCTLDPPIPLSSTQGGIKGNWSGPGVLNDHLDPTGLKGLQMITFTPDPGQCALVHALSIDIQPAEEPSLTPIEDFCIEDQPVDLPSTQDGITGSWAGTGVMGFTFDPGVEAGSILLTFNPEPGQCALPATLTMLVNDQETLLPPNLPGLCMSAPPYPLPKDIGGITGLWSGHSAISNNHFDPSDLSGFYELTFKPDPGQCLMEAITTIEVFEDPVVDVWSTDPFCSGSNDGSIKLEITSGTAPFKYDWNMDGIADFDDPSYVTGLESDTYLFTVKDRNDCISQGEVTLSDPIPITLDLDIQHETKMGHHDGTVAISITGGMPPFSINWSHGLNTLEVEDLAPGAYSITITDQNGCSTDTSLTISAGCGLQTDISTMDILCHGDSTGNIGVTVDGGSAPYQFRWSHDALASGAKVTNLSAGTYWVTIEDEDKCSHSIAVHLEQPQELSVTQKIQTETTRGAGDGSIELIVKGGIPPYKFLWASGLTTSGIEDLTAGIFQVTITDVQGCQFIDSFEVDAGKCALETMAVTQDIICQGDSTGQVTIGVEGGTEPLEYSWSHNTSLTQSVATGLTLGAYSVTITDASGCQTVDSFFVDEPSAISLNVEINPVKFSDDASGSISLMISGGLPPYNILWNTGEITASINQLGVGTYWVGIEDAGGCSLRDTFEVPLQSCSIMGEIGTEGVSCLDGQDGKAYVKILAGNGPFTYRWSHDFAISDSIADQLHSGIYSVTITDPSDCDLILMYTIEEGESLNITLDAADESNPGAKDGWIKAQVSGGQPPFSYNWSNGAESDSVGNLKPGRYSVTITDDQGCHQIATTVVNGAECTLLSSLVAQDPNCAGTATGYAEIIVVGAVFPVETEWSHDSTLQSIRAESLKAGNYRVTVRDATGCSHTWPFEIIDPDSLRLTSEVHHETTPGASDGAILLAPLGGQRPYKFLWSNGNQGSEIEGLSPGSFQVTLTDDLGCVLVDSFSVLPSDACLLDLIVTIEPSACGQASGFIGLEIQDQQGATQVDWNHDQYDGLYIIDHLATGSYEVTVSDDQCSVSRAITVPENFISGVDYTVISSPCEDLGGSKLQLRGVLGGNPPYVITLDDRSINSTPTDLMIDIGTHTLRVRDTMGCIYEESIEITSSTSLVSVSPDTTIKRGQIVQVNAQIPDDHLSTSFTWQNRKGEICHCLSFEVNPTTSEVYRFTLRRNDGCVVVRDVEVSVSERDLFYIPNAVTPNGDGLNDDWLIYDGLDLIQSIHSLQIFDHRGTLIFRGSELSPNNPLPGLKSVLAQVVSPEVIFFLAEIKFKQGYHKTYRGEINVLR